MLAGRATLPVSTHLETAAQHRQPRCRQLLPVRVFSVAAVARSAEGPSLRSVTRGACWLLSAAAAVRAARCARSKSSRSMSWVILSAAPGSAAGPAVEEAAKPIRAKRLDLRSSRRAPKKWDGAAAVKPIVAKRLNLSSSSGAQAKWGGAGITIRGDDCFERKEQKTALEQKVRQVKWRPKVSNWDAHVTDKADEDGKYFGRVLVSHEVEVQVRSWDPDARVSDVKWVPGVVMNCIDADTVEIGLSDGDRHVIKLGEGRIRRFADTRDLCAESELAEIAKWRRRGKPQELLKYGLGLKTSPARSHAVISLAHMGSPESLDCAERMLEKLGSDAVTTLTLRELAHSQARAGNVAAGLKHIGALDQPKAAQLLIEVLALGLTSRILSEKERLGALYLREADNNPRVYEIVLEVVEALPKLATYEEAVRAMKRDDRQQRFTEPFNELLASCGRAFSVHLAFRVLEWMEELQVPKDRFTYEAMGLNTVKRVGLLRKVWDLPNMPEDEVCPEVVFAGRSNVGKSSLVNMLLNRLALAPTSARPGKTKTMDFFEVNRGHPALPHFRLVDVPGLGFARASKDLRERWVNLIGGYFVQRKCLKIVFHLLDGSLCELMPADRELWRLLAQAQRSDYELCICLTKADSSMQSQLQRFATIVRQNLRREGSELAMRATIFSCSAKSKLGKDTLWRKIWTSLDLQSKAAQDLGEGPANVEKFRAEQYEGVEVFS
eukprot:TRINITY_DN72364_c0_g1_i1.p1 TRINITY_DN72364_c0_g1~~TRINITY_DN72364_c0_g1_i1.p1  ORF type:complete len:722 (+),score=106.05 TRINITY_DN72364_c0_g1_i1:78-2243(+)